MEEEDEIAGASSSPSFLTAKLPSMKLQPSHRSGSATPPLQISASVPFRWEEKPGKPLHSTALFTEPQPVTKFLELPPCRLHFLEAANKFAKTPSPTAVLDGPYSIGRSKFSSFRFFREKHDSFDSYSSLSPEASAVDDILIGKKNGGGGGSGGGGGGQLAPGFFAKTPKFYKGRKKEVNDDGVFWSSSFNPSCDDSDDTGTVSGSVSGAGHPKLKMEGKMKRKGSFSRISATKSTWAAVCEGIKQVLPWKGHKNKTVSRHVHY